MRVAFNDYNIDQKNNLPLFNGSMARKLIKKVKDAKRLDKLDITFSELESMYNEIGYDVFYKRGSHAVIHVTEDINLPVVIPHKTKNVHPFDLKRFKYILNGEIQKALDC